MGAKRAAVGVISGATDDVSSVAPRLRPKGSGGIFFVRDGVWRVDIEVGRDKLTGRRRRVSRQVPGNRAKPISPKLDGTPEPTWVYTVLRRHDKADRRSLTNVATKAMVARHRGVIALGYLRAR